MDYAYAVVGWVKEIFDKVASKPELREVAYRKVMERVGEVFESMLILMKEEHRQMVYELIVSWCNMEGKVWEKRST